MFVRVDGSLQTEQRVPDGHAGKAGIASNGIASDALAVPPDGGIASDALGALR
jgi:hypothetical protein